MADRPFYDRNEDLFDRLGRRRGIRRAGRNCLTGNPLTEEEAVIAGPRPLTPRRRPAKKEKETSLEF